MLKNRSQAVEIFENSAEKGKGGSIIRKPGSQKLYILFYYFGKRIEKTMGLVDTPENREKVRLFLDRVIRRRDTGTLIFAEAFPGAPEAEKKLFAKLEGRDYSPQPRDVLFGDYLEKWERDIMAGFDTHTKRHDYRAIINRWIKPYFSEKSFYELTKTEIKKFIGTFRIKIGPRKGSKVSRSTAGNIICVLRNIVDDAISENHWDNNFPDIFRKISKLYPSSEPYHIRVFLYEEWQKIVNAIDPWYRPMVEFMLLTGMIHSEISGFKRCDIYPRHFLVERAIVRGVECNYLKNKYRRRKITISEHMRKILDEVLARTDSDYVFANPDGTPYRRERFIKLIWAPALEAAEVAYRRPYSLRHSFAAWCLQAGVRPLRLVRLMGHNSKKMVFDVYGEYVDGLDDDHKEIVAYLGRDFIKVKK